MIDGRDSDDNVLEMVHYALMINAMSPSTNITQEEVCVYHYGGLGYLFQTVYIKAHILLVLYRGDFPSSVFV